MLGDVWKKSDDPLGWYFSILIFSMVKKDPTISHVKTHPRLSFLQKTLMPKKNVHEDNALLMPSMAFFFNKPISSGSTCITLKPTDPESFIPAVGKYTSCFRLCTLVFPIP